MHAIEVPNEEFTLGIKFLCIRSFLIHSHPYTLIRFPMKCPPPGLAMDLYGHSYCTSNDRCWEMKSIYPQSSSRIVEWTLPSCLMNVLDIPSNVIESEVIPLNPNSPECGPLKKQSNSWELSKKGRRFSSNNLMLPIKRSSSPFLYVSSLHGTSTTAHHPWSRCGKIKG